MALDGVKVWVLDTSSLIESKDLISINRQWEAFKLLEKRVEEGRIAMPRQVIDEITTTDHPDLPGAWAPGMRAKLQHILRPDDQYMESVMAVAGDVIDQRKRHEDADPWVLALALQLKSEGIAVCIVTEDIVDRGSRISIASACGRLGLDWRRTREFLEHFGIPIKPEPKKREDG